MKRRWLFNVLSALSLLLGVAAVALWVRSRTTWDRLDHVWVRAEHRSAEQVVLVSDRGVITASLVRRDFRHPSSLPFWLARVGTPRSVWQSRIALLGRHLWNRAGFGYLQYHYLNKWDGITSGRNVSFPDWLLVLLFATLPAVWIVKRIRALLCNPPGHCQSCGYNLSGNISGICPECGTPAAKETNA